MSTAERVPAKNGLEMLSLDHRAIERLFADLKTKPAAQTREWVFTELVSHLLTHTFIEEEVLYPAIRTAVQGGDDLADASGEEHRTMKAKIARLEQLDPNDHETEILLAHLERDLGDHIDEEEGVLFIMLRSAVGEDRLVEMSADLEEARRAAPRPAYSEGLNRG